MGAFFYRNNAKDIIAANHLSVLAVNTSDPPGIPDFTHHEITRLITQNPETDVVLTVI